MSFLQCHNEFSSPETSHADLEILSLRGMIIFKPIRCNAWCVEYTIVFPPNLKKFIIYKKTYLLFFTLIFTQKPETHTFTNMTERDVLLHGQTSEWGGCHVSQAPWILSLSHRGKLVPATGAQSELTGPCWQFDLWHFKLTNCLCFTEGKNSMYKENEPEDYSCNHLPLNSGSVILLIIGIIRPPLSRATSSSH